MAKKGVSMAKPNPSVRAKGVPQHVVDKLDIPALPVGYYYKISDDGVRGTVKIKYKKFLWRHITDRTHFLYPQSFDTEWLISRYSRTCEYLGEVAVKKHSNRVALAEFWS